MLKDFLSRGKKTLQVDLKNPEGVKVMEKLCKKADVLIDPFRAGVMERIGLGPDHLMNLNNKLIYARLTGYGQQGPMAKRAGHDINYLAISGVLSLLGDPRPSPPKAPINLLADFGGGGLSCALGICLAIIERNKSGTGQVVDANMVEGVRYLSSFLHYSRNDQSQVASIMWPNKSERGVNLLDGGAQFYSVYETKDAKYMAVGALEPQFFYLLLKGLGIEESKYQPGVIDDQMKKELTEIFKTKTQQEWINIFENTDACVSPVLSYEDASDYHHNKISQSTASDGSPIPAPRLSRTPGIVRSEEGSIENLSYFLKELGLDSDEIEKLLSNGIVKNPDIRSKL